MQYTDITSRALTYLLRSPHLHIDMTEAIYRGLAEICCAQPDGVLLRLRAPWNGRPFLYENSWNPMSHWSLTRNTRRPNIKPCIPASPNAVCKASGPPLRRRHGIRKWRSGHWI